MMVRQYLMKPVSEMEQYIISEIQPRMMDRMVVSRVGLVGIMNEVEPPLSFCGLKYHDQCKVLAEALRNLKWKKYSKGNGNRINAWVLPEVKADV
jgi:hypothetical protein